jgi:hypothetical protein
MPKSNAIARTAPLPEAQNPWSGRVRRAAVAAVEFTVSVAVVADAPVMLTLDGRMQVGGSLGLTMLVVTAQERLTAAANPPEGVTVMVEVFPVVAPGERVRSPLFARANAGLGAGAVTLTFTAVLAVIVPVAASVPVTVIE